MMTFTRYALKIFLWNFCVLWISFTSLLQIVDLCVGMSPGIRQRCS